MKIHRDGFGTIGFTWLICLALIVLTKLFVTNSVIATLLILFWIAVMVFIVFFFRVPARLGGDIYSPKAVTSVADGEVVIIDKVYEPEFLKKECIQVSIFMSFFNAHINFWPFSGKLCYYKYHPGRYFLAQLPKASELNEHASIAVESEHGIVFFKQIAGTFARRIVTYAEEDSNIQVHKGEQCGLIKFGSRIDMFLPLDADIKVEVGDDVRAVASIIAELHD